MMKKFTLQIAGSICRLFRDSLPLYLLLFSFFLSAQVSHQIIYVSDNSQISGFHHISVPSEIQDGKDAVVFVDEEKTFENDKGYPKIRPNKTRKKEVFNIQKEAKKKIAKKLKTQEKIDTAKINSAKSNFFFRSGSSTIYATFTTSQWIAKKEMINSYWEFLSSGKFENKFIIGLHKFFLNTEITSGTIFIRPPPEISNFLLQKI